MAAISQALLDGINKAEASYEVALAADADHSEKVDALTLATQAENDAANAALGAHRQSTEDGQAVLDLVKKEFGLS